MKVNNQEIKCPTTIVSVFLKHKTTNYKMSVNQTGIVQKITDNNKKQYNIRFSTIKLSEWNILHSYLNDDFIHVFIHIDDGDNIDGMYHLDTGTVTPESMNRRKNISITLKPQ